MPKFQPGQSGNPSGRPKSDADIKALARTHTQEAINKLVDWMRSDNPKASVAACVALLDRAWGKAPQSVTGEGGGPIAHHVTFGGRYKPQ
jgi:hypothetical protein